jgi:DNA ligase-1
VLFSALAQAFAQLEETSSRTLLGRILADTFRELEPGEVAPVSYLLQGRLAAAFVPLEMGMGVHAVIESISRAYAVEPDTVRHEYDRAGDLGTTAGRLAEAAARSAGVHADRAGSAGVKEVFDRLVAIAGYAGAGSAERKVTGFVELLTRLDPLSATYVCRVPLRTLRLGVGDLTIIDAFSVAWTGDKRLRAELERAYNETSDLGLLGVTLWSEGEDGVARLGIRVGNPVRAMLAERLPSAEAIIDKLGTCAVENKYDGFRCQVHKDGDEVRIFSRNLEETTASFPEIAAATRDQIRAATAIFEGEALAYNPLSDEYLPFQQTVQRRRKHAVAETAAALPLRLFAFDLLYLDGDNITGRPYVERRELLGGCIGPGDTIDLSRARIVVEVQTLTDIFETAIQNGLEGIMAKRPDSPYRAGARSYAWVKLKRAQAGHLRDTVDCVIIGYLYGRGRRAAFGVGALLVAVYDPDRDVFTSITKIGTGLSDQGWREIRERCAPLQRDERPARVVSTLRPDAWIEPEVVVEVLADEITRSPLYTAGAHDGEPGYALRFPRVVGFRGADKRPEDATTVAEIIELYDQQGAAARP